MRLSVNGLSLPIKQMGGDFLLLESPVNHPSSQASIVLHVDDSERCWNIWLPAGISSLIDRVAIAPTA
jgi:hypothetical protein